jgi:hypothetical protein
MKILSLLILMSIEIIFVSSPVHALRAPTAEGFTENDLNFFYTPLEKFKDECKRFPFTFEGLNAVFSEPLGLDCKKYQSTSVPNKSSRYIVEPSWTEKDGSVVPKDGWGEPLHYTSDGKTYRIDASHDYFMTNLSPKHYRGHWQNNKIPPPPKTSPFYE